MQALIDCCDEKGYKKQWVRYRALETSGLKKEDFTLLTTYLGFKPGFAFTFEKEYKDFWKYVNLYRNGKMNLDSLIQLLGPEVARKIVELH